MPNAWIEKLKQFNADGHVWAIPKKNTEERKMLDRGQRFKYSLLKERFPDLAKQLEEEVSSREAKAKMRKAEELIKQAEAIDSIPKRRRLRLAKKEEETSSKTDAVAGEIKTPIYNKMEGKTAMAYYEFVDENESKMPKKVLEKYAEETGMTGNDKKRFLNNASRSRKVQARNSGFDTVEEFDMANQKEYEEWLNEKK